MDSELFDVIVSGAGPAGATAAYQLARKGARVALLEKERLPRYKTCGGGLTAKTVKLLDFDISPVVEQKITGVYITARLGFKAAWRDTEPICFMVMRSRFDQLLAQKAQEAGATLIEGVAVKSATVDQAGVTVTTRDGQSLRGKIVVGADGANGVIAKSLDLMRQTPVGIGLEAEVRVSDRDLAFWRDQALLDLGTIPDGYGWIFPKGDHLSIGVGGASDDAAALKEYSRRFTEFCRSMLGGYEVIHSQGHRLPTSPASWSINTYRGLVVGDAAGLVNRLDGEGIYYAIRSGQIAADAINDSLAGKAALDLTNYRQAMDEKLLIELRSAEQLFNLYTRRPTFYAGLLKSKRLHRSIGNLLRGDLRYSQIPAKLGPFSRILNRAG